MISEYQLKIIADLPKERQDFIRKQLTVFGGFMEGDMFMAADGYCYYCKADLIKHEIENGNDGSYGVTGCFNCHRSYCD
jgi:hypothetical protein